MLLLNVSCKNDVHLYWTNLIEHNHTGLCKGCGYRSSLCLQFLKDVATGKNGRFARVFSGNSTTNAHFTEVILSLSI